MPTPTFLDNLLEYNAKASLAIANAVAAGNSEKANMMSSLKTVANDTALDEDVRLKALTTLINTGNLLDAPIPPYFPLTQTYANALTYSGIHNDLLGLNVGNYQHLTEAEKADILNKASLADITWANLQGVYTDNVQFAAVVDGKQEALSGTGYVKINGTSITYDNSVFLTDVTGLQANASAGGELQGNYPNPTLNGLSVITKALTGFTGTAMPITPISQTDSILVAIQKLNNNIVNLSTNPAGVSTVALTNNATSVFTTTTTAVGGPNASLNISLNTQNKNLFLASSATANGQVPAFRAMQVDDLPDTGNAATTIGGPTTIPVIQIDAKGRVTSLTSATAANGGIVNTVNVTVPSTSPTIFTASGGGSASTVNVGFGLATQIKNTFWAGPQAGANSIPVFRQITIDDISFNIPNDKVDGLKGLLDGKLGIGLGKNLMYIGNGSGAAEQSVVGGDLSATYQKISGDNTAVFTINSDSVTYSKFQNVPTLIGNTTRPILLGRWSASSGDMEEITLSSDFTLSPTGVIGLLSPNPPVLNAVGGLITSTGSNNLVALNLPSPNDGYLLMPFAAATSPACGLIWGEVLGDISYTVDSTTTPGTPFGLFTIGANKVGLAKIAQVADQIILGNNSGATDDVAELSMADVIEMLPLQDALSGTTQGVVPASNFTPASGKTKDDYFLNANNGWALVNAGGTLSNLTFDSSGSGDASPVVYDGSAPFVISYNTIGAPKADGTTATGTWPISVSGNAATVTNGIYSNGTYSNPSWITGLAGSKITGNIPGGAAFVANSLTMGNGLQLNSGTQYNGNASVTISINPAYGNTFTAEQTFENNIVVGELSGASGAVKFVGGTGGYTILKVSATADNKTYTLPGTMGTAGNYLKLLNTAGDLVWDNITGVASLGFGTQGLIFNSGSATAPVLAVSGNSGGVVYFSNASTWASSGALDQYELMMGGGAGAPPTTINNSATAGAVLTSNGTGYAPSWTSASYPTSTSANRILYSSAANVIDEIVAPSVADRFLKWDGSTFTWATAGGGGSGTVNSGSIGQLAIYTASTAVSGFASSSSVIYSDGSGNASSLSYSSSANLYLRVNPSGTGLIWDSAGGGGSGTVNNGQQYGVAYYPNTGTAVDDITPPTTNGGYFLHSNVTASTAVLPEWLGSTGTGNVVRAVSPTLSTPNIGAATAASINLVTITAPATGATLTLANGSTLATSGAFSTTLTATATTAITLPTTGTLATLAGTETLSNKTLLSPQIGDGAANGHAHFRKAANSVPAGINNYATLSFHENGGVKRMSILWDQLTYQSNFALGATADQTYTFPNATGTVALINASNVLSVAKSGTTSGAIALGGGTSGTITLQAPATVGDTGTTTYTLPTILPGDNTTYYLRGTTTGGMSWQQITGGGNVNGPGAGTTAGNFAVFSDTSGTLIGQPISGTASLTATGRATFNDGVDVGASGTGGTTGSIVFRAAGTAFTTTIQQSTSASANVTYVWPSTGQPTAGFILANDGNGNLSWTAAGAGNMILASTQTNTGAKTFNDTTLLLRNSGNTFSTTLSAGASGSNRTITFPDATGTVPLLGLAQSFTATQTFTGGVTINTTALSVSSAATFSASAASAASVTINPGANSSVVNPQLLISGNTAQWMSFGAGAFAAPANIGAGGATRSVGTKINLYSAPNATSLDIALGAESGAMWLSTGSSASTPISIKFYVQSSTNNAVASIGQFENSASCYGLNIPVNGTAGIASLLFSNTAATHQYIRFGTGGFGDPSLISSRSLGTRIILSQPGASNLYDAAIGASINTNVGFWFSNTGNYSFWSNNLVGGTTNNVLNLSGTGVLNLPLTTGRLQINGTQVVGQRIGAWGAPTGTISRAAFTTTASANYVQAELTATIQALKAVITDLQTHGLIGA